LQDRKITDKNIRVGIAGLENDVTGEKMQDWKNTKVVKFKNHSATHTCNKCEQN